METKLKVNHDLFKKLENDQPLWWTNLIEDKELYVDIRKDNSLNVYYNGGSLMKLEWKGKYKALIHFEYVPLQRKKDYVSFEFSENNISLEEVSPISINNFTQDVLINIKKRISKFYQNNSEKGVQGKYVITNNGKKNFDGFFIDTEFAYNRSRIDLVWVDLKKKHIAFVELKTIDDSRLYPYEDQNQETETIDQQLTKYHTFIRQHSENLIQYYDKVYQIKRNLKLLPSFATNEKSLSEYKCIEKPILLVGNCTRNWIDSHAKRLNEILQGIAFGCVYQGKDTFGFNTPYRTSRYTYHLSEG